MLRIKYPIYALSSFEIFEVMTWHFTYLKMTVRKYKGNNI